MGADRRGIGNAVEACARAWLIERGLRPLAANVGYGLGELDLVMHDPADDCTVFVEVRHRTDARFGGAASSVDARKRRKLVLAAQAFLLAHPARANAPCRFDVVVSEGDSAAPTLHWLRDAFRADD